MTKLIVPQIVAAEAEVDGIEMGVLADGTAYLSLRGLAAACGMVPSTIIMAAQAWNAGKRTSALAKYLIDAGFTGSRLSIELQPNKHAVPDSICILVLGYYALKQDNDFAKRTLYVLAREGLAKYIYSKTGYNPAVVLPRSLRDFYDRLMLNRVPVSYYSVLREMAEFLLRAIQAGLPIDDHTVPDGSVGILWAKEWAASGLEATFGPKIRCDHYYPDHYPQAASNPQDICAYPIASLGLFRKWLDEKYIPTQFPKYLDGKVKQKVLARAQAERLVAAVTPAALPPGP